MVTKMFKLESIVGKKQEILVTHNAKFRLSSRNAYNYFSINLTTKHSLYKVKCCLKCLPEIVQKRSVNQHLPVIVKKTRTDITGIKFQILFNR